MKYFVSYSSSEELPNSYYDLVNYAFSMICDNDHELYLGLIHPRFKDFFNKHYDKVNTYIVEEYKDDTKMCPKCHNIIVKDSFERLKSLCDNTDSLIILPGGTGTLSEMFGILEQYRYSENNKKIYIVNNEGFYDDIIKHLNKLIEENYSSKKLLDKIEVVNIEDLEKIMKEVR